MNQWEIRRVSTSERVLAKIAHELPQPVGVIIMGEDGNFKNQVIGEVVQGELGELMMGYCNAGLNDLLDFNGGAAIVILDTKQSQDRGVRAMCVRKMHQAGAKTVVGVYTARSILLDLPPDAEEMDYLVTVNEETRGPSRPATAADSRPQ